MKYSTVNIHSVIHKELLQLKQHGYIQSVAGFTSDAIKKAIKELKANTPVPNSKTIIIKIEVADGE